MAASQSFTPAHRHRFSNPRDSGGKKDRPHDPKAGIAQSRQSERRGVERTEIFLT